MGEVKSKFANPDSFSSSKSKKHGLVILIVGIIILIILVVVLTFVFLGPIMNKTPSSSWSAIFLTNGRSYFGKITKTDSEFITLDDVYYLQVQQVPPSAEGEESQPQLSLISIGDEIHGPENFMRINKDHVLFIEKLKANSSVVASIEQQMNK